MIQRTLVMKELQMMSGYFKFQVEFLCQSVVFALHSVRAFDNSIFYDQLFKKHTLNILIISFSLLQIMFVRWDCLFIVVISLVLIFHPVNFELCQLFLKGSNNGLQSNFIISHHFGHILSLLFLNLFYFGNSRAFVQLFLIGLYSFPLKQIDSFRKANFNVSVE